MIAGYPDHKPWLAAFAKWQPVDDCKGKWRHTSCVYGIEDLPQLMTRKEFFANKFDVEFEPFARECLAAWIKFKEVCPQEVNLTYYENLPFVIKTLPD